VHNFRAPLQVVGFVELGDPRNAVTRHLSRADLVSRPLRGSPSATSVDRHPGPAHCRLGIHVAPVSSSDAPGLSAAFRPLSDTPAFTDARRT